MLMILKNLSQFFSFFIFKSKILSCAVFLSAFMPQLFGSPQYPHVLTNIDTSVFIDGATYFGDFNLPGVLSDHVVLLIDHRSKNLGTWNVMNQGRNVVLPDQTFNTVKMLNAPDFESDLHYRYRLRRTANKLGDIFSYRIGLSMIALQELPSGSTNELRLIRKDFQKELSKQHLNLIQGKGNTGFVVPKGSALILNRQVGFEEIVRSALKKRKIDFDRFTIITEADSIFMSIHLPMISKVPYEQIKFAQEVLSAMYMSLQPESKKRGYSNLIISGDFNTSVAGIAHAYMMDQIEVVEAVTHSGPRLSGSAADDPFYDPVDGSFFFEFQDSIDLFANDPSSEESMNDGGTARSSNILNPAAKNSLLVAGGLAAAALTAFAIYHAVDYFHQPETRNIEAFPTDGDQQQEELLDPIQ